LYTERVVRTNIELDDELVAELMRRTGLKTKKAVVNDALRRTLELERQKDVLELWGIWADNPKAARIARDEGVGDLDLDDDENEAA
jgi:Arc/MetJ family transcription regulator